MPLALPSYRKRKSETVLLPQTTAITTTPKHKPPLALHSGQPSQLAQTPPLHKTRPPQPPNHPHLSKNYPLRNYKFDERRVFDDRHHPGRRCKQQFHLIVALHEEDDIPDNPLTQILLNPDPTQNTEPASSSDPTPTQISYMPC